MNRKNLSKITNFSNGWLETYTNDDFVKGTVTRYKDFEAGSKYGNVKVSLIYNNRILTILLKNKYKIYKSFTLEIFSLSYLSMEFLLVELLNELYQYENEKL